jgi:aspartyl-tRNA(Asn)/glutamyl-tRNA(Gln) amidotransferase subunit C
VFVHDRGDAKNPRQQGINPTFYLIIPQKPASRTAKTSRSSGPPGGHLARFSRLFGREAEDPGDASREKAIPAAAAPRKPSSSGACGAPNCLSTVFQHYVAPFARPSTMSLALSDVKRIANLSRLELTDAQAGETLEKLNGIFALVEQMRAVDTAGVEPLSHPIAAIEPALALRLREDAVTEGNRREDYQQPAPATQDGLYLVPKVIE